MRWELPQSSYNCYGRNFHNHSGKISELEGLQTSFKRLSKIIPNSPMSMEELKVADEVVDELKALGTP